MTPKADEHLATARGRGGGRPAALPRPPPRRRRRPGGRRGLPARGGRRHGGAVQDPRSRRARPGRPASAAADSGADLAAFIGTGRRRRPRRLLEKHGVAALPAGASLAPTRAKLAELAAGGPGALRDAPRADESDASAEARLRRVRGGRGGRRPPPADATRRAHRRTGARVRSAARGVQGPGGGSATRRRASARGARGGGGARRAAVRARGFPAGLLERIFRDLHAGDVLDETAMKAWRDDEASAIGLEKIKGKEKALFETMEPCRIRERRRGRRGAAAERRVETTDKKRRRDFFTFTRPKHRATPESRVFFAAPSDAPSRARVDGRRVFNTSQESVIAAMLFAALLQARPKRLSRAL